MAEDFVSVIDMYEACDPAEAECYVAGKGWAKRKSSMIQSPSHDQILSAADVIKAIEQSRADALEALTDACMEILVAKSLMPCKETQAYEAMERVHGLIHDARRSLGGK